MKILFRKRASLYIILLMSLIATKGSAQTISAAPNPFAQHTLLTYQLPEEDTISVLCIDATGKLVFTLFTEKPIQAGTYADTLKLDYLPAGIYFLQFKAKKSGTKLQKLVKSESVGINDIMFKQELLVYPNPSAEKEVY